MSELQPRITGTEMEWSLQTRSGNREEFTQAPVSEANRILQLTDPGLLKMGQMLSNGARLYVDVGDHPEYATPEDVSFRSTVANEIAGENILYDALVAARERGILYDFILNKRVVDDQLRTWGYHISLSADATKLEATKAGLSPLGPHLATVNLYTGAGAIVKPGQRVVYAIAQKSLNLNTDFNTSSHQHAQPLISLRDEPHAPLDKYRRVHITSLDANISPWSTWMKLGTTSIVLRMIENGYWDSSSIDFEEDMYKVALAVAYDPDLKKVVRRSDGKTIRPLDVQGEILQQAMKMADTPGTLTKEEMQVLKEWERALTDLAVDPIKLIDRADWVLKRAWLSRYMSQNALRMSHPRVIRKDRQWSHMGPEGIGVRYRDGKTWKEWMPHKQAEQAYLNPPTETRALARAAFIAEYAGKHYETSASWTFASAANVDHEVKARFNDPYATEPTSLETKQVA